MRFLITFLIFGLCYSLPMAAQDSLLLINGNQVVGRVSSDKGVSIFLDVTNKKGKVKTIKYERSQIYSMHKQGEKDTLLYAPDPLLGFDLNPVDMRYYMHGQADSRGHKMIYNDLGGLAFGLGSAMALNGGTASYLSPVLYSLGMQIPVIKVTPSAISNPKNTLSPLYLEGYGRSARGKKFVHGFLSTMSGVLLGSGILLVTE